MYVYNKEISAKNWNVVLGGAALWGNGSVQRNLEQHCLSRVGVRARLGHAHGRGDTALLILIGYNIEISFMFAMMGVVSLPDVAERPQGEDPRHQQPRGHGGDLHHARGLH
jgi:hypothetical protein